MPTPNPNLGGSFTLDFGNLYFNTTAVTPTTGSNLGFEIENSDAFTPGVAGTVSTVGTGVSYTDNAGTVTSPAVG